MNKLRVKWSVDLEQDLDSMVTYGSMFYNKELVDYILANFGSIENYKKSEEFKLLKDNSID